MFAWISFSNSTTMGFAPDVASPLMNSSSSSSSAASSCSVAAFVAEVVSPGEPELVGLCASGCTPSWEKKMPKSKDEKKNYQKEVKVID